MTATSGGGGWNGEEGGRSRPGSWLPDGFRRVFRIGIVGGDADREVDRELEFHFERAVEDLMASGHTESEARAEARRRFGDERRYRRKLRRLARGRDRRSRAWDGLATTGRVVLDAWWGVRHAPLLATAVVLLMALGIGANATMFGVLDRLFLTPPAHVDAPDRVKRFFVHIRRSTTGEIETQRHLPFPAYTDWTNLDEFSGIAAFSDQHLVVGHGASAERLPVTLATASFFPTLGVRPAVGRFFGPEDDTFGSDPVAVLGHSYWQRRYGGDPAVIGETVDAGDETYAVIGVAPPGFTGVDLDRVDVWLPLHRAGMVEEGGTEWVDARTWYWVQAIGRLVPGVEPEAAEAAATTIHRTASAKVEGYDSEARVELAPLLLARTAEASREARVVPWLVGVALMVLLLTCANVANLLLARTMRRRRETAVRLALGISRARLVGTVVMETVLLALLGGVAAVLVTIWGGEVLRALLVPGAGWESGRDTIRVVIFSGGLALVAGLVAALVPSWRASRPNTTEALKASSRGATRRRSRLRAGLLVFQAAVSVILLIGTGLFVLSLREARGVDLGFEPEGVLLVRIEPEGGYPGGEEMTAIYRRAHDRVKALPGVEASAVSTVTPFRNARGIGDDLRVPGLDSLPRTRAGGAYIHAVTGEYFETMGLEVLRGRPITEADDAPSAPPVAGVNATMARLVWPDGDALGSCLIIRDRPCATVVGVVEDHHRFDLSEEASMNYFVPLSQAPYPWPPSRLMIRAPWPATLGPTVRHALRDALPDARLITTEPFADVIDSSYRSWQLGATLFSAFGVLALIVAAAGLYSVLAFDIAERRAEIGIRAALGASRARLVRRVLTDGVRLAAGGVVLGVLIGIMAARRAEPLLFGVSATDPIVLVTVSAGVLLVAAVASGLPAWRAARVDPNDTLRAE